MKITEFCPFCENEVELDNVKYIEQECPVCHKKIRACSLCDCDKEDCSKCKDTVFIICYGTRKEYDRQDAILEFSVATHVCEGHERERYAYILSCLLIGDKEINDDEV